MYMYIKKTGESAGDLQLTCNTIYSQEGGEEEPLCTCSGEAESVQL